MEKKAQDDDRITPMDLESSEEDEGGIFFASPVMNEGSSHGAEEEGEESGNNQGGEENPFVALDEASISDTDESDEQEEHEEQPRRGTRQRRQVEHYVDEAEEVPASHSRARDRDSDLRQMPKDDVLEPLVDSLQAAYFELIKPRVEYLFGLCDPDICYSGTHRHEFLFSAAFDFNRDLYQGRGEEPQSFQSLDDVGDIWVSTLTAAMHPDNSHPILCKAYEMLRDYNGQFKKESAAKVLRSIGAARKSASGRTEKERAKKIRDVSRTISSICKRVRIPFLLCIRKTAYSNGKLVVYGSDVCQEMPALGFLRAALSQPNAAAVRTAMLETGFRSDGEEAQYVDWFAKNGK